MAYTITENYYNALLWPKPPINDGKIPSLPTTILYRYGAKAGAEWQDGYQLSGNPQWEIGERQAIQEAFNEYANYIGSSWIPGCWLVVGEACGDRTQVQ